VVKYFIAKKTHKKRGSKHLVIHVYNSARGIKPFVNCYLYLGRKHLIYATTLLARLDHYMYQVFWY